MAQRRMFSLQIVDTDAFLEMPVSTQALYFHLAMRADDDGFVSNPKKIMKIIGVQEDDLKILLSKRFLLDFESGVVVIKHWKIHNYIQNDRYNETKYIDEKNRLITKENGSYTECIQNGYTLETQVRLGKDSIGKDRLELDKTPQSQNHSFFNHEDYYKELLELFSKNNDHEVIKREFKKFILYWTESNKSGTKKRWETEKTFEVKKRLFTWLNNVRDFKKDKGQDSKYKATNI